MQFSKGSNSNLTYPLTQSQIDSMSQNNLHSPRVGKANGLTLPIEYNDLPSLCDEVELVVAQVQRDEMPMWFLEKYWDASWGDFPETIPEILANEGLMYARPRGLANVVHMDKPWHLFNAIHSWLLQNGYEANEQPVSQSFNFLENVVHPMRDYSAMLSVNMEKAFEAKYFFGIVRPEELEGHNFTFYGEGCPFHPDYPAGHSVTSWTCLKYFQDNWNLDTEAILAITQSCYLFSMFRSFAGVHYPHANLAGRVIAGV